MLPELVVDEPVLVLPVLEELEGAAAPLELLESSELPQPAPASASAITAAATAADLVFDRSLIPAPIVVARPLRPQPVYGAGA